MIIRHKRQSGRGTTVIMGAAMTWMAVHYRRGSLQVDAAAKAHAMAAAPPATTVNAGTHNDNRQYHDNRQVHYHDNRTVHVHQATAAEPRPAIAVRKVAPGALGGLRPGLPGR